LSPKSEVVRDRWCGAAWISQKGVSRDALSTAEIAFQQVQFPADALDQLLRLAIA